MNRACAIVAETLRALCVLALVFLNFGHTVAAFPGDPAFAVAVVSYCGDPIGDHPVDHAPCHACRIGNGADLPPPPVVAIPAVVATILCYDRAEIGMARSALWGRAQSRGPPIVV